MHHTCIGRRACATCDSWPWLFASVKMKKTARVEKEASVASVSEKSFASQTACARCEDAESAYHMSHVLQVKQSGPFRLRCLSSLHESFQSKVQQEDKGAVQAAMTTGS
jgi:hypothetical protein